MQMVSYISRVGGGLRHERQASCVEFERFGWPRKLADSDLLVYPFSKDTNLCLLSPFRQDASLISQLAIALDSATQGP
jgi:hypothetical protein